MKHNTIITNSIGKQQRSSSSLSGRLGGATLLFLLILVASFTSKAQTTYYFIANGANPGNITNTVSVSGVTYWRHLTTTPGSTVGLVPTSVSLAGMGNDDFVIDNTSFSYTTATVYNIYFNTNVTLKNINTTAFTGGFGGFTQLARIGFGWFGSTTTIKKDISMTTSTKLGYIHINNILEIDPNAGQTSNLLFGQRPVGINTRLLLRGSGGTINFNDSLITIGPGYAGNITIQSNTPLDATNSVVNFNEGVLLNTAGGMVINRGWVNFYKNVCNRNLGIQVTAFGTHVRKSLITIGSVTNGGYTHVMFNKTGISQNKFSRIGFIFVNGYANFTNVLADSSSLWSTTVNKVFPGGPTAPSAPVDTFLTAANTHFNFLNSNYGGDQIVLNWNTAAILRGTYKFYAMPASGASQVNQNNVYARFYYTSFKDSVHFRCNAQINCNQGSALGAPFANFNSIIDTNAVMVLDKGFIYDLTNSNYASGSFVNNLLNVKGKLVVGGTSSCGSGGLTILKYGDINFNFGAGTPHLADIQNTQLISTRARPSLPATFVSINANNTDMGGNQGWGIGGIPYGTAPYNTIPYTGTSPRSLIWNNAISGATFWNEAKWYNEADGDNVYDDCPPTYIDSVTVRPSSSLSIDVRFAQCKTLYFQGATSMLTSKRTQSSDSLNTLEIFGSLIIDNQLNNRFYRNIHFKAWQSYPIIKTSGTFFHRGLAFRSLNSAPTTTLEINRGVWTLQDTLNAYSSAETFTTAPAPAAPGTKYIINRKFYAMIDVLTYWPQGYNCSTSWTDLSFLVLAGKLNTNGYNVNCNDFTMASEYTLLSKESNTSIKSLDMGWKPSGTPGINRKTTFNIYHTHNCNTSPNNWYVSAEAGRTTLFADSSHVKLHAPNSFMNANATADRRLHYWDITFMFSKPTIGANGAIGAWFGFDARLDAGQTHARHITFYGSDFSAAQHNVSLRNDTIRKLTFLDTRANTKTSFNAGSSGSTIDTLISNPPTSNIFGNNRIRKYIYFAPGSNNSLNTSTISVYQPTVTPRMIRDSLTHSYKVGWPYGAEIDFVNNCYVPGIITGGRIVTAGNAVAYPTPHHYNLPTPRDTFDIRFANISTNTLSAVQTVDGSNTLNNTVNWIAGATVPRVLVFRGNAPAHGGNWADNNVWALATYVPAGQNVTYTVGAVGECAPNCSDTVIFDNQSFLAPTDSCYFTSGASAYVGLLRWKNGAIGKLSASRLSQLTVCYAWDCENGGVATGMDNRFFGRIQFTSPRPDAYIKSSGMTFGGPVEYISTAPLTGTLTLRDDITFKSLNFDNTGLSWTYTQCYNWTKIGLYIVAGTFDSQSKTINAGMFQSISSSVRAIYLRNSTLNLVSGSGTNHGGYMLGGTMANLTHHAESAIINISGGSGGNCYYGLFTWLSNSLANSYQGGYKFKTVNMTSTTGCTGICYGLAVSIRNDTIADTLKINGNVYFYEAYRRSSINKLLWTNTYGSQMGNANTFASGNAFVGLRINEFTFTSPPGTIVPLRWDSIFVKDKYSVIAPGATIFHTTGGVTHFGNKCKVLVEGSSSGTLLLDATPNTKAYPTYNIPGSATYATAEHYYRKDSGTVCTEHTNIKNLWAIGNGNVYSSPTHGTWSVPNPSPTPHYSLIDTTQGSSYYIGTPIPLVANYNRTTNPSGYTTNVTAAGRARFYVGQNATLVSNAKGWDDNKFPPVPSLTISTTTITVCQTQTVSLYFTGISGIPFNLVYENTNSPNKDTIKITSTSQLDNYNDATNAFTVTTVVSPTTSTNYFLGYVITDRCTNNVSAQGTGTTSVIVNPIPSAILATSSPTTICNAVPFNLNANATAGQTYTLFPTPTGTNTPTPMASYTVGAAVNGSVTIAAGTFTAGSSPETYTVYAAATTSLGCASLTRTPVQITINPTPSVSITSTNVACFGNATGAVSYTATGGSGGGYSISPSITGLTQGTYNYTVTDANGCKTNTTATITQPASALTALSSGTNNTSCITADGQVSVNASGGTSGYAYVWSTGSSTLQTVSGLTGGTYTVTVTDNNNCTYTTQATIANPSAPIITASSSTNTICNGNNVTITPSGGATTYSIIPSIGTATTGVTGATILTPTATTSYSVVGTNSTSCLSNTVTLNVNVNATPVVTIAATSNTICNGQSTTLNLTGASTYTLVNTGTPITSGSSFNPSANTTYTVIGSTAGCVSANTQQLITVNALPVVTATANAAAICSGNTATLTAAGADTYTWTSGPTSDTYTVSSAGTYSVTGTNTVTGCSNISNVTLAINALPVVTANASSASICSGNTATLTAGGATTYTWTSPASTNTIITVTPTAATIYTVTGTDANNCVNSRTVSVGVNATPTVAITAANNTICIGNSSALTLAGASTYTLLNDNTPITSGASVSPTTTTTYSIQGSTGTCTSSATQQVITVNALPVVTATASSVAICSGNTATLTATGADTYTWTSGPTAATQTVNATGTYTVRGTNAVTGCTNTANVSVLVNPLPVVTANSSAGSICSGNTATLTAGGAQTYTWTSPASTNTVITVAPTAATIYTVSGTDANGCVNSRTVSVAVNATPTVAITAANNTICLGNSSALNLTGATSYTLLNDNTPITSGASVSPTTTTTYSIQGSTGTCTSSATQQVITVNALPVVTATANAAAICSGNTATLTAAGANTYTWSGGPTSNTYTVNATNAYVVTGTDANNCVNTATVNLTVNPTPTVAISASSATICSGQTATLTAATANSYVWSTSSTANTTTVMPTGTTVYTVTGTNTAGSCVATAQFTVNVNPKPDLALTNTTNIVCLGDANGTATVNTTNGTSSYTYVWTGSASTSSVATNLAGPTHTAIVTDARGCKDTLVVNIAAPSASLATAIATSTTGCSLSNGTATLTPNGGWNSSYTYVWQSNASATYTATGYAAGTYTAQVTDANGCVKVQNFTISNPTTPSISAVAANPTICSGLSTTITPSGAVSYSITGGAVSSSTVGASFTVNPTANTTYSIIGTDASNCISTTATVSINVNTTPTVNIAASNNTICIGNSSALTLTGASTYTLLNDNTTITSGASVSPTTTTTYSIQGSTGTCTSSATQQVITVNPLPAVTATTSAASICSGNTATLTAAGANTYTWSGGPTSATYTVNATNAYVVTGTDANNCVNTATVNLTVNPTPTVAISASSGTICSGQTTTLTAATANNYSWSSGETINTITVAPTTNTVYTVIGTNTAGTCTASAQYSVTVNTTPTVAITAANATICNGQSTSLNLAGASTYTLLNTNLPVTSGASVSPTTTTTYSIQGSIGTCTSTATQQLVTVNPLPTVTAVSNATAICVNQSATLTAGGAQTYTWTSPASTNTVITVNPTTTTSYVVMGTDANNCVNTQTVTLTVNALPTLTASTITNVTCFGANNGSVNFTPAAGTPTYAITGTSVTGTSATGLAPADYTYTVTDAAGCQNTTTLSITQPTAALAANAAVTATNSSCTNPNGAFAITATGGTSTYSYSIDGGALTTNSVTSNLSSGPHTYVVTDANGCTTTTGTVNISGTPGITSSVSNKLDVLCYGNNTASVSVTGAGGSTYDYTLTPMTASTTAQSNTTGNFSNLSAGTYSVLVVDQMSNCISTNTITINTPTAALALTGVTANSVVCNGGTAQVTTTVTGGTTPYTYVWSAANTSTTSSASYTAGNYNVTITDFNGCALATQNFTVAEAPVLTIASVATTTTGCGLSNASATVTATGGWNTPSYDYVITSATATVSTTNTVTNLAAGTYSAIITDALGCTTQTVFTISNPTTPTLNIASTTPAICAGETATLTPTGAVSYTLASASATFATNTTVTPTTTTVYNITGTDASNCTSAPLSVTVTVNELPTLNLASSNAAICVGQTATLTANTTGTTTVDTYTWSTGASTVSTTTVSPTAQTVYTVAGTNTLTGCVSAVQSVTVNINQNPTLSVASQTNVTCLGSTDGIVTFTTDASSYTITPANTGLASGTQTFTVTDLSTTCTNTVSVTIAAPSTSLAIASVATTTTGCGLANGSATITANGGWNTSYTYSVNGTTVTNPLTNLAAATYTADVMDALGCATQTTFVIANPNAPTLGIAANPAAICAGNSVTLTPTGAVSYTITNPVQSFTTSVVLTPSTTTVYDITGTDASSCTSAPLTVTVNVNALPTISVTSTSAAICAGNTATLTANTTGTTTVDNYNWNTGATVNSITVSPTAQTVYTVAGTNTLTGCVSAVQSITVNVNTTPTVAVASQTNVLCFGNTNGAVDITTSATTLSITPATTSLTVGSYTFTITDLATTCTNTVATTIAGPTVALTAVVNNTTTNTSCATPNGAFTVTALGGTPNYTYNATNTTGIFVNQGTGSQNITVADANGCTFTVSATIPGIATPSISAATQTNVLCNGGNTGAASITVINGTPTYTYTWSNNAGLNSNTQANLPVGPYTVTATDAGSCTVTQAFIITEPSAINAITSNVTAPCVGQSNGAITIELIGGTPSYNVAWNPTGNVSTSGNTSSINDVSEGQYIATITDANSCSYQYPVQLVAADGLGCSLVIPEIFSPNGDGKNDTWEIKGLENYPNNNVTVFNRWGDQVFKAEPYKNDWDGTNTGDKSILGKGALPAGTYYFILDLGNGDKPITGYVQITK